MSDAPVPKQPHGRVVIELTADNVLVMECYRNGQRQRVALNRGQEYWEIIDELHMQRRAAQTAAERKAELTERKARTRHNRIWIATAETHGAGFAKAKIKGATPPGYGRYLLPEPQAKAKAKAKDGASVDAMLDLL